MMSANIVEGDTENLDSTAWNLVECGAKILLRDEVSGEFDVIGWAHKGERIVMAETSGLRVGDRAPDFTLPSATGEMVSLASYRGKADVVLFFYPKDETAVCTAEACSFRDSYEAFQEAGAEVIGISSDTAESHQRFADRNRLPFLLLSDTGGEVRARYGIKKTLGLIPGRTTFLIDREGIIRSLFSSQFQAARHVSETLGVLQTLHANRPAE